MKTGLNFIDKLLKIRYNIAPILQNRFVLYFFCFITIIDVIYFTNINDIRSLITLVLVGFLTSFFNKNMIVILTIALSVTHMLKYGIGNTYEGLENNESADVDTESKPTEAKPADDKKKPSKEDMMKEYEKYKEIQPDLVDGIAKIDPLLKKAESFIEKYESYKGITGFSELMKTEGGAEKIKELLTNMKKENMHSRK